LLYAHTIGARFVGPVDQAVGGRGAESVQIQLEQPKTLTMSPPVAAPDALAPEFVRFAVDAGVLRFGEFRTKAGRMSPYFFNAGAFDDGARLGRLANFYARRLVASGVKFDMLFGPAYKGIVLAAAVAIELARMGRNVPYAYNRKEAKDHGEGGVLVGAKVAGRVLIVDDVISAGTSVRESIALITAAGATPCGVAVALDRQERAMDAGVEVAWSAVQYVTRELRLDVAAIATLQDLLQYLSTTDDAALRVHADAVLTYRRRYGV
jgi:orotate phosphoribosyltransferase